MYDCALQNLSAGIIIGSVAGELFPLLGLSSYTIKRVSYVSATICSNALGLEEATSWENTVALFSGFLLAIGIMFGLDKLLDICEGDDDEDDDGDVEDDNKKGNLAKYISSDDMRKSLLGGEEDSISVEANKIGKRTSHADQLVSIAPN